MIHSKRAQEGLLTIDHRESPGLPGVPKGHVAELPTIQCNHCCRVVVMNPLRTRQRGYCSRCHDYLCDGCAAIAHLSLTCTPWRKVEDSVAEFDLTGRLKHIEIVQRFIREKETYG